MSGCVLYTFNLISNERYAFEKKKKSKWKIIDTTINVRWIYVCAVLPSAAPYNGGWLPYTAPGYPDQYKLSTAAHNFVNYESTKEFHSLIETRMCLPNRKYIDTTQTSDIRDNYIFYYFNI